MDKYLRKEDESIVDYKERLYKNRRLYNLSWEEVRDLLGSDFHHDSIRKASYGYLEAIKDMKEAEEFDNRLMIINDIHLPFERKDVLELIAKHADEINVLVIGGDLMDCKSISSFPDMNRGTLVDELLYSYEFMKKVRKLLNKGQKIIMINGNHEERLKTMISKMQEKNLQPFLNPNILEMLVEGFALYVGGKKQKYDGIEGITFIPSWYVIIDDLIISHPFSFANPKGKMLENATQYFLNKGIDFSVIIFGHTHKYSSGITERFQSKFAIENACLCKVQGYANSGKLSYSPQSYGYTLVKYNNGEKINLNNIKTYLLEVEEEDRNFGDNYIKLETE